MTTVPWMSALMSQIHMIMTLQEAKRLPEGQGLFFWFLSFIQGIAFFFLSLSPVYSLIVSPYFSN